MRLVYIIGMPSGGTKATAGALKANGFWCPRHTGSIECEEAYDALKGRYSAKTPERMPDKPESAEAIEIARKVFESYKSRAANADYDKCFMKAPGMPIWCPELFVDVEPLLVWREPGECARSMINRAALKHLTKGKTEDEIRT